MPRVDVADTLTWNQIYRMAWLTKFRDALLDDDGALAKSYGLSVEDIRRSLSDQAILEKIAAHEEVWQSVIG